MGMAESMLKPQRTKMKSKKRRVLVGLYKTTIMILDGNHFGCAINKGTIIMIK